MKVKVARTGGGNAEDNVTVSYPTLDATSRKLLLGFITTAILWSFYISLKSCSKLIGAITAPIAFIQLILVLLRQTQLPPQQQIGKYLCIVGLIFHSIGDIFLVGTPFFNIAVILYGVGHTFYILRQVLVLYSTQGVVNKFLGTKIAICIYVAFQGTLMFLFLMPTIPKGNLIITVLYSVVLLIEFIISAFNIVLPMVLYVPSGVYLYLLADISLLLSIFDIAGNGYAAMFYYPTYFAGNALIVMDNVFSVTINAAPAKKSK